VGKLGMARQFLIILILLFPFFNKAGVNNELPHETDSDIYSTLHLSQLGLSAEAYRLAIHGFEKLKTEGKLQNDSVLTIIDFSQSSNNKRMYVIDLMHKTLLFNTYVAHGRNTGGEYAEKFSNKAGTYESSLGFYITQSMATGAHVGLSLILQGIEKGFNDMAKQREIIIHGAAYATEQFIRANGRLGRSFGCPSIPPDLIRSIAEAIKDGSCLFIYYPDNTYLSQSAMVN
jgi:hypothetical protein